MVESQAEGGCEDVSRRTDSLYRPERKGVEWGAEGGGLPAVLKITLSIVGMYFSVFRL